MYFTRLTNDVDQFFARNLNTPLLVEPKIDGEDLILVRTRTGEAFCVNRYNTYYRSLPFVDDIPEAGGLVMRGEMYVPNGKVYDLRRCISSGGDGVVVAVHDILYYGEDLRLKPLQARKEKLKSITLTGRLHHMPSLGTAVDRSQVLHLFEKAVEQGYEGVVVKPLHSPYADNMWLKIKRRETKDVLLTAIKVSNGYLENGVPWTFRMEAYVNGKLEYVGDVSSGLDAVQRMQLKSLATDRHFYDNGEKFIPLKKPIIAEVECQEILTGNGVRMRHPKIVRLREDKPVEECVIL